MIVRGIHEVMSDLLVKEGVLGKYKADKTAQTDIRRGIEVASELGRLDVGQSVVVQQGLVLGVEGIEGTDELLRRCGDIAARAMAVFWSNCANPSRICGLTCRPSGLKPLNAHMKAVSAALLSMPETA